MTLYFFDFGRDSKLSYFELQTVLDKKKYEIVEYNKNILLIESNEIKPKELIQKLAGTRKIGIILGKIKDINDIFFYQDTKNKFNYSISYYDSKFKQIRNILKQRYKKEKLKAKYCEFDDVASPTQITRKKLLDIIVYKDFIGKTIAVPNLKEYEEHDEKRPSKISKYTISIRLARIMINLSEVKKGETLLDPFCGFGTIIQEAGLRGIKVIGSDIEKKFIESAKKNLEYFKVKSELHNIRAEYINKVVKSVDVVVTEPYLGPFIKDIDLIEANKNIQELNKLYEKVFKTLGKIVKKKIVIILPYYIINSKNIEMKTDFIFSKSGFKKIKEFNYKENYHNIGRKIYVLNKEFK